MNVYFVLFLSALLLFSSSVNAQAQPTRAPRAVDPNTVLAPQNRPPRTTQPPLRQSTPGQAREQIQENVQQRRQTLQELRQENKSEYCEEIATRMEAKVETFEQRNRAHSYRYQLMVERLESVLERFNENGYDVASLETALQGLQERIEAVQTAQQDFLTVIKEAQEFKCENTDTVFRDNKVNAEDELSAVREAKQELRTYFENEVIPAIQQLRSQLPSASESATTETSEEEDGE